MPNPRAWVEVAGQAVPWAFYRKADVESTLYMAADSAEIVFRNDTLLSDFLRKQQEVRVWMGYVADPQRWGRDELTHVFTGLIDGVLPAFEKDMTVRIMCRDYSAPLIDSAFTGSWENLTTSELATALFRARGLTPVVTATETIVLQELVADRKEWEILQAMAERDGFVCYVDKNKNGYYGPRQDSDEQLMAALRYRQGPGSTVLTMEFDDTKVGIINRVIVRHYLGKTKGYVEAIAEDRALIEEYGVQQRIFHDALAKDQATAQRIADAKLKLCKRQAVTARGTVPGHPGLLAEAKVQAIGFGRFSGPYYIDLAKHTIDKINGYTTQLTLVNLRPENTYQYRDDLNQERGQTY